MPDDQLPQETIQPDAGTDGNTMDNLTGLGTGTSTDNTMGESQTASTGANASGAESTNAISDTHEPTAISDNTDTQSTTSSDADSTPGTVELTQPTSPNVDTGSVATPSQPTVSTQQTNSVSIQNNDSFQTNKLPFWKRLKVSHYLLGGILILLLGFGAAQKPTPLHQASITPVASPSASLRPVVLGAKCHVRYLSTTDSEAVLPDPNCTPGVTNPAVTQANIATTICVPGYTKTIRPSVTYTDHLKQESIQGYGYTDTNMRDYEEDHYISLELGGSPTSPLNLWAEPHASPNEKDKVENYLHSQVCAGKMTLAEAQREISTNWYQVYLSL